jgi:site-specific DNA-methyltransferase (adenine-specific)
MPISEVYNEDCLIGLARYPDNFFQLSIVDPPYGIDRGETFGGKNWKEYEKKKWDKSAPTGEYFAELRRVSKNQIIWGANYFPVHLDASMGWIFWDKGQDLTMSDGELAFSSFDRALRRITLNRCYNGEQGGLIHPTQKPVKLYKWLLQNYANTGDKILDTHLGSGSSRIAAYKLGFDFYGWEIDKQYFEAQEQRFKKAIAEPLFEQPIIEQSKMFNDAYFGPLEPNEAA